MIRSLRERLLAPRAPSGYRPGTTLACLARNLGQQNLAAGVLHGPVPGWQAQVHERIEAHLLMHIVTCEFQLLLPAPQGGDVSLELRHTGALRRTGLACVYRKGDRVRFAQLRDRLLQQAALVAALMPLDFKRLTLAWRDGQWLLTLEHMGGSEVVNRMPAFRRYIPISPQQRAHLMASLAQFNALLPSL
ncbi:MAG: DUF3156 family protein [Candidatus Pseudomonas phytovorans]|uniref:DUF3156 family protein n=1 Tax=Candidatus Pseudomonas phytovorans TaxID=3121377 RepID=A0AAJ6BER2_9PSED|nr:DUF3156 family protein [Pseudomonas sp.]WEK33004.1 MAG: DUF3156 family protein [Pseudomonas sp.]